MVKSLKKDKFIEQLFINASAFKTGHFKLSSGLHSETYIQSALVLQNPEICKTISVLLIAELIKKINIKDIDVVVAPAIGALTLGYQVASLLGKRFIFCEKENNEMKLRRGFSIGPNEKVLIIENVVTTGLSVFNTIKTVNEYTKNIIAIGAIMNRSSLKNSINKLPFIYLNYKANKQYKPNNCPLCKANVKLIKPGSNSK